MIANGRRHTGMQRRFTIVNCGIQTSYQYGLLDRCQVHIMSGFLPLKVNVCKTTFSRGLCENVPLGTDPTVFSRKRKFNMTTGYETAVTVPKIGEISFEDIRSSPFIKPIRMRFSHDGVQRAWDMILVHNSVCVILFEVDTKRLVFVRQFRPAVYVNGAPKGANPSVTQLNKVNWAETQDPAKSVTLELCAGIVDKDCSLLEIAQEEIMEETGYEIPLNRLERVTSFRSGVGVIGDVQTHFYAEVYSSERTGQGGGNIHEHENIEIQWIPCCEAGKIMFDENLSKPPGLLFGLSWFFRNKAPLCCRVNRSEFECRKNLFFGFSVGLLFGLVVWKFGRR